MSITIKLALEIEQIARARAEAKGISVEEYLSDLVARVLQQEVWGKTKHEKTFSGTF